MELTTRKYLDTFSFSLFLYDPTYMQMKLAAQQHINHVLLAVCLTALFPIYALEANGTLGLAVDLLKEALKGHEGCWLQSYERGIGRIPQCGPNLEKDAGLCYPSCEQKYHGVGPVCWPTNLCYGRGIGKLPPAQCGVNRVFEIGFCYDKCDGVGIGFLCWHGWSAKNRHISFPDLSCGSDRDQDIGLCYPKCEQGFKGVGPVCWNKLPPYGRGIGKIPGHCPEHIPDYDAGLCYKNCPFGTNGVGPLCWKKYCPKSYPFQCGAVCMKSGSACAEMAKDMAVNGLSFPLHLFSEQFVSSIIDVVKIVKTLVNWAGCEFQKE